MSPITEELPFHQANSTPTAAVTEDELTGHEVTDSPNAPIGHGQTPNGETGMGFPERQPFEDEEPLCN